MLSKYSSRISLLIVIACCLQLSACSWLSKPKEWFVDDKDPREPTKLTVIDPVKVDVQSLWKNSVGDLSKTYNEIRPHITEERVYLSSADGRIHAWKRSNGKSLWSVNLKKEKITGGVNGGEGVIAVGNDNGDVIAFSTVDGAEQWRTSLTSEVMAFSAAKYGVVASESAITSYGVIVARTNDSKVHALDTNNGNVIWTAGRNLPPLTLRGVSEPKIIGDVVLVGFENGKLTAFNLQDGAELWQVTVSISSGRSELDRMSDIDGEFVYLNGIVYVTNFNGRVVSIDADTGKVIWIKDDVSSSAGLSVDETQVYVTDADDSVWALDKSSGATVWRQDKLLYRELTAPEPMGNYLIVGDYDGYVHWLAKEDGRLVGRKSISGKAIKVKPTVINGQAHILTNGGSFSVWKYRQK